MFFPSRRIRSKKSFSFIERNPDSSSQQNLLVESTVQIFYDNTTKLIQTIAFNVNGKTLKTGSTTLTTDFEEKYCIFMMDNREFKIISKKDTTKQYLIYKQNSLSVGENCSWRLDPIPGSSYIFGGKYFIVFLNPTINENFINDNKLMFDGVNLSTNATGDVSEYCQWEFIYIFDTDSCLIKNVATGKFLSVNSNNNTLVMENSYDASENLMNNTETLRKQWFITSSLSNFKN
jgi:hypothetical protein